MFQTDDRLPKRTPTPSFLSCLPQSARSYGESQTDAPTLNTLPAALLELIALQLPLKDR